MALADSVLDRSSLVPFDNVTAGHRGLLMDLSGDLVIKPCLQTELDFYAETVANHPDFAALCPTYMGTLQLDRRLRMPQLDESHENLLNPPKPAHARASSEEVEHSTAIMQTGAPLDTSTAVVLENVVAGYVHPNIVDIKLGKQLWADDYEPWRREKRNKIAIKTTSHSLGFRVSGMKIWKPDGYALYDKFYGRALSADNIHEALEELLCLETDRPSLQNTIQGMIEAIENIANVVRQQESRIYASSLLLVYEGDHAARRRAIDAVWKAQSPGHLPQPQQGQDQTKAHAADENNDTDTDADQDETPRNKIFDVRCIDFGHATWTPGQGPDENMLGGIRRVVGLLKRIRDKATA